MRGMRVRELAPRGTPNVSLHSMGYRISIPDREREVLGQYRKRFGDVHLTEVDGSGTPNRF
jgi:hypothetical protein